MSAGTRRDRLSGLLRTRSRTYKLIATVVVLVVAVILPLLVDEYYVVVLFQVVEFVALAQAWNLLAGYGGLVSLAPAASVGLGGYAAAIASIHLELPLPLLMLTGGLAAGAFAALVSFPMFRFRGLYFAIATLVLAMALGVFMVNFNGLGGATGLFLTNTAPSMSTLYYYALGAAAFATLITVFVLRTRLGLSLRALRDDEDTAQEMGVITFRTKLWVFVVSSFLIGVVGALQTVRLGTIEPYGAFSLMWTINIVSTAIVGGIGTIVGPIVGSGFTVGIGEWLAAYPEIHIAIIGAIVIVIIRFAPTGIWGVIVDIWEHGSRWWRSRRTAAVGESAMDAAVADTGPPPDEADPQPPSRATAVAQAAGSDASIADAGHVLLRTRDITKRFGDVVAVSEVDIEISRGEVLGIIGPNGAGKSTLVGLLSGALRADGGTVELDGDDVTHLSAARRARRGIGRTHQIPRPFHDMTVLENLLVARSYGGRGHSEGSVHSDCWEILREVGLSHDAHVKATDLTLLQLKRLELARALALEPQVLLMDEIGAGLVESELVELITLIRRLRTRVQAIVIIEHIMDVIQQCCDRVAVLDWGRQIAAGSVQEVLTTPEVVSCYLGTGCGEGAPPEHRRTAATVGEPLLVVDDVAAGYGRFKALHGVSFTVHRGEVITLLGANGAGKTTCARVISGMVPVTRGSVELEGASIAGKPAHEVVRLGLAHCMEGRRIFADLTVHENLVLAGEAARNGTSMAERLDRVYGLFPVLAERRRKSGKQLSGGQQQMLAIGRALMAEPKLVIFDEIALGLAPTTIDDLYATLVTIRDEGTTMIIIEQNVERGLALADHVFVLEKGTVALSGTPAELRGDPRIEALYVGEAEDDASARAGAQREET